MDVLEGQLKLKWVHAGMSWDPQYKKCHGGAAGAEAVMGPGFPGCSAQGASWQGGWNQGGHGLPVPEVLYTEGNLVRQLE